MFQIIDCTQVIGCECHVRGKAAARIVAWWFTFKTGRYHDYVPATAWSRTYEDTFRA